MPLLKSGFNNPIRRHTNRMKLLNAQIKEHPELLDQRFTERAERVKAKTAERLRRAEIKQYIAAIQDFWEVEECSPDTVIASPLCIDIARRFKKTPAQVAEDINRRRNRAASPAPRVRRVRPTPPPSPLPKKPPLVVAVIPSRRRSGNAPAGTISAPKNAYQRPTADKP